MRAVKPRTKVPRRKESYAQNAFLEALALKGIRAWRVNSGNAFASYTSKKTGKTRGRIIRGAPAGTPDTVVHIHGSTWAHIEWKRPGKGLTPEQLEWQAWAKSVGALHAVHTDCQEALAQVATWRAAYRQF